MTTYTSETVTCTFRRWIVPAAEPWGATSADIGAAWTAAQHAFREQFDVPVGEALPDDALRFHVRDDAVVIEFTVNGDPT